jgi:type II secretory pathway pseudopilin PulG
VRRRRSGYSIVELLVVLAFIGLLTRLAIPRYTDMKRRATAASIIGDVHAIRVALFTRYAETQDWPAEAGPGVIPAVLQSYLPDQFTFTHPDWTYDYEVWTLSSGTPTDPQQSTMIGVAVTVNDVKLANQIVITASKGYGPFQAGNKVTFFVTGFTGS